MNTLSDCCRGPCSKSCPCRGVVPNGIDPSQPPKGWNPNSYTKLILDRSYSKIADQGVRIAQLEQQLHDLTVEKAAAAATYSRDLKRVNDELTSVRAYNLELSETVTRLHHSVSTFRAERRNLG